MQAKGETELEYELRGKTWRVYWLLLKIGRPVGVREVQRTLRFSSPSLAQHHLERLRHLGLVEKQDIGSRYFLVSKVKIGVLRHFVKLGRLMLPRYFFTLFSQQRSSFSTLRCLCKNSRVGACSLCFSEP